MCGPPRPFRGCGHNDQGHPNATGKGLDCFNFDACPFWRTLHGREMGRCFAFCKADTILPVFRGGRENYYALCSILRENRSCAPQCNGLVKRRVGVDIRMPLYEMQPIPVGSTPCKMGAILAQEGFVRLALMPFNSLWLRIAFTTSIARVGGFRSSTAARCQWLLR